MPVPSPRNSIRIARGNYADLDTNITEIGEGELCFAIDQDRFYSKSDNSLVAVGGGTELYSIAQLGDVTLTALENGQFLQWNGSAWVNVNAAAPVDSVNGKIGTVVLALDDIDDVDLTTVPPNAGEVLGWNGSEWVPTENTGAGSTINSTRYRYENSTDLDSTGAGKVRFNNTNFTLVTEIAFSNIDKNGVDISAVLQNMIDENYSVYFQQEDNAGKAVLFHFTGGCSNVGDGIRSKFPVEYISDSGSALGSGKDCYTVISAQAVADSVTSVNGQQGAVVLTASDVGAATTAQGALADTAVQPGDLATVATSGSYNDLLNQPTIPPAAPVDSVNTQTGAVVLDADDIDDTSTTHKFATAAQLSAADTAVQPGDNVSELANDANYVQEAPTDGARYARQSGGWSEITESGGDLITVDYSGAAAWGSVDSFGSKRGSGLNFTSVRNSEGNYSITFDSAMPNAEYSVTTSQDAHTASLSPFIISVGGTKTASGFTIDCRRASDGVAKDIGFGFAVHALNALPPSKGTGADGWARTGSAGSVASSFNLTCAKGGTGVYNYTFTTPMPDASYAVVCNTSSSGRVVGISNLATTGFTLTTENSSNVASDAAHHVIVHATTAALPNTILKEDLMYTDGRYPLTAGIQFPATQNASADPNTLDDYEEGTFVPSYISTGTNPSVTYSLQQGGYRKIGNLVNFTLALTIDTVSSIGTGSLQIGGFPFTSVNDNNLRSAGFCGYVVGWVEAQGSPAAWLFNNNTSDLTLYRRLAGSTYLENNNGYLVSGLADSCTLRMSGTYFTAS